MRYKRASNQDNLQSSDLNTEKTWPPRKAHYLNTYEFITQNNVFQQLY